MPANPYALNLFIFYNYFRGLFGVPYIASMDDLTTIDFIAFCLIFYFIVRVGYFLFKFIKGVIVK